LAEEKTLSSQLIYEGCVVKLRVDTVRMASGRESTREIVEHSDCVAIVAVDADDNVLLVRQYRKPIEKELLEIPAGGYLPRKVERLGGFYSTPGYCTEYLYLYLATDLVSSQLHAEDTESIKLIRVSISQIPLLIASGDICDAKSIAGLLTYLEYRKAY